MVSFDRKSYSKRLLPLISWSHWFTFFNIAIAIALSSLYLFDEASPDSLLGHVYLLTTWLSHMAFITFIGFMLIVFPITLLLPYTKFIRSSASIVFTLGLLLLMLDIFIYSRLGYHLYASSSGQILSLVNSQIKQYSWAFYVTALLLALVTLAVELLISNYAWKHLKQLQKTTFARPIIVTLVGAFFFSHITHIWADAKLDYNVLRQDTVMPLSYPSTAKTLLTKYGLFNRNDYVQRTTSQLSFADPVPNYPSLSSQCTWAPTSQSVFMVLTKDMLSDQQIEQFSRRSVATNITLQHHIDNALYDDAWFNLLYSLPSIYQQDILKQQTKPLLFQALDKFQLAKTLTVVNVDKQTKPALWFETLFDKTTRVGDISSLIFADKFNSMAPGLHLIYFDDSDPYQYELFVDALLSAQKQKADRDIIWLSSIGNDTSKTGLTIKPALLVWPKTQNSNLTHLTSHMDLQGSLMKNWLSCDINAQAYPNSADLLTLNQDRVIANTMVDGIMVFNKDKSMFVDQDGAFRSSSRQLEQIISVSADFPLMIDGVHFIKRFSQNSAAKLDKEHNIEQ